MELEGAVAVVTGGGSGIARGIARALARARSASVREIADQRVRDVVDAFDALP